MSYGTDTVSRNIHGIYGIRASHIVHESKSCIRDGDSSATYTGPIVGSNRKISDDGTIFSSHNRSSEGQRNSACSTSKIQEVYLNCRDGKRIRSICDRSLNCIRTTINWLTIRS
ncbi:hypothetical protein CFAEC_12295 [Corynebacterium faecale]|nr:hypothetical protein CFAEC_12295 [Corynebacterium faecale]